MFAFLKGKIESASCGVVELDVGGVGYEVNVSNNTFVDCCREGETVKLLTYLKVSDDGLSLYGFSTQSEKQMFLRLISVSGVGAKLALTLLSGISPRDLAVAIATKDVSMLSRIKGIGKKTAERIILELKESTLKDTEEFVSGSKGVNAPVFVASDVGGEAITALMALGFTRAESNRMVTNALSTGADTVEKIITSALRSV